MTTTTNREDTMQASEPVSDEEWYGIWYGGHPLGGCVNLEHALREAEHWARIMGTSMNVRHAGRYWSVYPNGDVVTH